VSLSNDAFPLVEAAAVNVPLQPTEEWRSQQLRCGVDDGNNLTA